MNSIKELKEQLGYEEIGLDDTFTFHCTQCGKCCIHREDILLSPKDLFNIAKISNYTSGSLGTIL